MIYDMFEEVTNVAMDYINANMLACGPLDLGLDPRAGGTFYVGEDGIAVRSYNRGSLDYYGGFEYVSSDCVHVIGNYTFYLSEDPRVADHIETYLESKGLCTTE